MRKKLTRTAASAMAIFTLASVVPAGLPIQAADIYNDNNASVVYPGDNAVDADYKTFTTFRGIPFTFRQTGAVFIKKGKVYHLERKLHISQAQKSGYSYVPGNNSGSEIKYQLPDRNDLFLRLSRSDFRSRFHLTEKDKAYISEKGLDIIRSHAKDFIKKRLSPENPENDGKQTPMKGHPVFIAQHATACCCRGCIEKWHNIPSGKVLTQSEQAYITDVIMEWIEKSI